MKKFLRKTAAILAASVAVTGIAAVSAFAVVGDIDGNGRANSSDARAVLRYAAKIDTDWTAEQVRKADLNGDGNVNSSDARILLRAAAKIDKLETYKNFYVEIDSEGTEVGIGVSNGDLYISADIMGPQLCMLLKENGNFVVIDTASKRYGEATKQEMEFFDKAIGAIDDSAEGMFSELLAEMRREFDMSDTLPTPAALIDRGYVRGTGTWNGKSATTYTAESGTNKNIYYYNGMTILGVETVSNGTKTVTEYKNFTSAPESRINAYKTYKSVDIMELLMDLLPDM